MRVSALLIAIGVATCAVTVASAAEPSAEPAATQPTQPQWIKQERLDSADALERLRTTNPRHYAIARKILAAANEICDAQKGAPMRMKFEAQNITCASAFWLTSNPPKRVLSFRIEDTGYSALVEVRNLGAKLRPADPAPAAPVTQPSGK